MYSLIYSHSICTVVVDALSRQAVFVAFYINMQSILWWQPDMLTVHKVRDDFQDK